MIITLSNTFWIIALYFGLFVADAAQRRPYVIDRRSVCKVKTSCLDCLMLKHCSWCPNENKCFSSEILENEEYCKNDTIRHMEYGFSLKENAACSCAGGELEQQCYPPGVTEGAECSGRGKCICGQCVCNPTPDAVYPTMVIMGEFCEFDNFSCKGSKCNEGPYSINQSMEEDDEDEYFDPEIDKLNITSDNHRGNAGLK